MFYRESYEIPSRLFPQFRLERNRISGPFKFFAPIVQLGTTQHSARCQTSRAAAPGSRGQGRLKFRAARFFLEQVSRDGIDGASRDLHAPSPSRPKPALDSRIRSGLFCQASGDANDQLR
jgi:hypothetical protein